MLSRYRLIVLLFTGLGSLLVSCGDEHDPLRNITPAQGARIKFIHASPDAPEVDIYVNDVKVSGVLTIPPATPGVLTYPGLFPGSEYVTVAPGTASVKAVLPQTGATALAAELPLQDGQYYSVFAVDSAKKLSVLVLEDYVDGSLADSKSYLRFVHLIPNGAETDLAFSAGTTFTASGAQTLFTTIGFKGVANYTAIEPGTYSFQLRNAGTITGLTTLASQTFEANRTYTLYARGFVGGTATKAPALTRYINK